MSSRSLLGLASRYIPASGARRASPRPISSHTMRPVIRGRHAAVASMKAEATEAARRILDAGGNAFDAAVAGQAALGCDRLFAERRRQ